MTGEKTKASVAKDEMAAGQRTATATRTRTNRKLP